MFRKAALWFLATIIIASVAWGAAQNAQQQLPEGEGKKILETACTVCHSLKEVTKFQGYYARENWRDIVRTMIADGAALTDAQVPVLVDYLTKTFPKNFPDGEGKNILETACSGCHAAGDVRRFDGYYTRNDWQDLVRTMIADGAPLKDDQATVLVDYLTAVFPAPRPVTAKSP
jgi:cytochrome c5